MSMRERGFNLIELMVTVAILALLMVAAMPSLGTWLDNTRIRNQADSVMGGLQAARAEAVRTNQQVSFWLVGSSSAPAALDDTCALSGSSSSWVVSVASPATHCGTWRTTPPTIFLGRAMGGDNTKVSVSAQTFGATPTAATTVTFNGFGRVANSTPIGRIDLGGKGGGTYRNLRVVVSPSGSVSLCDPAVSSSTDPRKCPATS
jgi:type IV fimbrial biogenesis protein FimT